MATGDAALLSRASVTFHTNDEDKDADSRVEVTVQLMDDTLVASITDEFGHFDDHSDAGPFELLITDSTATRGALKTGHVSVKITPNGDDTWRFNFFLDLVFEDGAHLIARANGLEVSESRQQQSFGIE
ncbi:MAG TPA: hypothetical protein VMS64_10480 [Candidatus Methylomirabilis sp.]|nr:hypothetical protein [Candidatus Methylomirabilis sp.]